MADYTWSETKRRYRSEGKYVPVQTIVKARDDLVGNQLGRADDLAQRFTSGSITSQEFVTGMRGVVKDTTLAEYMLGRGGRAQMTNADRGRVGGLLRAQYRYLDQFAGEIANGELSPAQASNRAKMYVESSRGAYDRGYAAAWGISLPTYPGEQSCRSRCKCRWRIVEKREQGVVHATWIRDRGAQSCDDCIGNADRYSPLIIDVGGVQKLADEMYRKAAEAEPQVTADLRTLEGNIDGDLNRPFKLANGETVYPLDNRLKTPESTHRKILSTASEDGVSVQAAAASIKDNLRYTYTLSEDGYGDGVMTVLNGLDDLGYERIAVKNKWAEPKGYTSVHGIYRTPEGQYFEVQFHTDRTLQVKELISHPLYEEQRMWPEGSPEWIDYQHQIDDAWQVIRDDPPNLSGVPTRGGKTRRRSLSPSGSSGPGRSPPD